MTERTAVRPSLYEAFDPKNNSLNAIRLFLAVLVIISHSWPAGDFGHDPQLGDQDLGDWAVAGFFVISGYLITASRMNSTGLRPYLWKRFLRLYPAFVVALLVVALLVAPLSTLMTAEPFHWSDAFSFVAKNLGLLVLEPTIGTTLSSAPVADTWNAPLWTLAYEAACYVLIGLVVSLSPRRLVLPALLAAVLVCSVAVALSVTGTLSIPLVVVKGFRLGAFFAAGAVLYSLRKKLPASSYLALASAALVTLTMLTHTFQVLAPLPLAYLLLWAGSRTVLRRIGAKYDLSYGMYIYAFPLQQLLQLLAPDLPSPFLFAAISTLATLPLAFLSCKYIEQPALKYKPVVARQASVT